MDIEEGRELICFSFDVAHKGILRFKVHALSCIAVLLGPL
jgi:hypothetical protein